MHTDVFIRVHPWFHFLLRSGEPSHLHGVQFCLLHRRGGVDDALEVVTGLEEAA